MTEDEEFEVLFLWGVAQVNAYEKRELSRVENYRSNVMGNPGEQEFMAARIAMLRRAENLYDAIQRERLSPPESGV